MTNVVIDTGPEGIAVFSPCRKYRYLLTRIWDQVSPRRICAFIMLNPSTADAFVLDPTIRRCVGFAKREGCTGLIIANLFAYRATKPRELENVADPCGPENVRYVAQAIKDADLVVAGWGAFKLKEHGNISNMPRTKAWEQSKPIFALKISNGNPGHPLYLPADSPLIVYSRGGMDPAVEMPS